MRKSEQQGLRGNRDSGAGVRRGARTRPQQTAASRFCPNRRATWPSTLSYWVVTQMSSPPQSSLWVPAILGFVAGCALLFLSFANLGGGWILDLLRALHYPSNLILLCAAEIFPLRSERDCVIFEGAAFLCQWALLGLAIGWLRVRLLINALLNQADCD